MKILAIFTCFNRKEKTEKCIRTLTEGNPNVDFTFVVADDNSRDGTREAVEQMKNEYKIHLLKGNGSMFYSGGMRLGMEFALKNLNDNFDYMLMLNDDVEFLDGGVEVMLDQSQEQSGAVIVGAMKSGNGDLSYSAIKYTKGIKYTNMKIEEWEKSADTFNANCVLVPYEAFRNVGAMDSHYIHSLGDFDYGLELKRYGYDIHVSKKFVGICDNNSIKNTWADTALSRRDRIRKKESVKGAPTRQWFYFLKKNFGLLLALRGVITPYIRIILGK